MALFAATRNDGRAEWRVVFDRVETLSPGDEVSHDELLSLLETEDMSRVYRAVARANRELWKTRQRSLGIVRGKGYRMLRADEHEIQSGGYKSSSMRQMDKAVAVAQATDLAQLDTAGRRWAEQVTHGLVMLRQVMDYHAAKIASHDALLDGLRSRMGDVDNLRERVATLENSTTAQ